MRKILLSALLVAGVQGTQVAAQTEPTDADSEIIIQGVRERDDEIAKFVGALTFTPVQGTISRFEWKVCPAVMGLTPALDAKVAARMRSVAGAAGVPLAAAKCKPNALVLLTNDKPRLLKRLEREVPDIYPDSWSAGRLRGLMADPAPVAAWQFEGLVSGDGAAYPQNYEGFAVHRSSRMPSRIVPSARRQFIGSVVVIDKSALVGLTTTQLADYAAMRSFVSADPTKLSASAAPTILKVIDAAPGAQVPITLTEWDLSFLKGVYSSTANAYSASQRSEIRKSMARDLATPQGRRE